MMVQQILIRTSQWSSFDDDDVMIMMDDAAKENERIHKTTGTLSNYPI